MLIVLPKAHFRGAQSTGLSKPKPTPSPYVESVGVVDQFGLKEVNNTSPGSNERASDYA